MATEPFVSVLTPVYNGEDYLAECIESVLAQDYQNYEYIIVNNCSTDRSLEIAREYALRDSRIRVHNNQTFVGVIENHNIAFRLISPQAAYCKIVSADDYIFPEYLTRMVGFASEHPSAGIIGCYQLSGAYIKWQGFTYPNAVITGEEICRRVFLGGDKYVWLRNADVTPLSRRPGPGCYRLLSEFLASRRHERVLRSVTEVGFRFRLPGTGVRAGSRDDAEQCIA